MITLQNKTDVVQVDGEAHVLVNQKQLESLLNQLQENQQDINTFKKTIISVLKLLGIWDVEKNQMTDEAKDGNYLKPIIKSVGRVLKTLTMSQFSKKAEAEMFADFAFIKEVLPTIQKYANR